MEPDVNRLDEIRKTLDALHHQATELSSLVEESDDLPEEIGETIDEVVGVISDARQIVASASTEAELDIDDEDLSARY
ncbi:MAG: hypothetical protein JWO51_2491 [Rhodospirillales bacterium]|nr:hypothetical protein [Rhodospirillales bacterium]